jgi:putative hydrolase of the HAD superfamily
MIKFIIFDIGGVIVDYGESDYYNYLSKKYGVPYKKVAATFDPLITKAEYGRLKQHDMLTIASKKLGIPVSKLEWTEAFRKFAKKDEKVISMMKELRKKYHVSLLSNVEISRYMSVVKILDHKRFYDHVFASCYIKMRKPEKRIYLYVADKLGAKPSECLFIDDRAINVAGAKAAGMRSIVFTNAERLEKDMKTILK